MSLLHSHSAAAPQFPSAFSPAAPAQAPKLRLVLDDEHDGSALVGLFFGLMFVIPFWALVAVFVAYVL